jgi:phage host-nuclease inhibitor protein Gam
MNNIQEIADRYAEAKARLDLVQAELSQKITALNKKYADQIYQLEEEMERCKAQLQRCADKTKTKITTTSNVKFGYREGREKIEIKDEDRLIEDLTEHGFSDFIRVKKTLDRQAILKECLLHPDFAKDFGVKVVKEKKFFVEVL